MKYFSLLVTNFSQRRSDFDSRIFRVEYTVDRAKWDRLFYVLVFIFTFHSSFH